MSILIERASSEERAQFFHKNKWVIARLLGGSAAEIAEEKPKRKRKTATKTKAKTKAKTKSKVKSKVKPKAKLKETPVVEKNAPEVVDEVIVPATKIVAVETPNPETTNKVSSTLDDLIKINGLGPKMVESLTVAGITTFEQLAGLTEKRIAELSESIKGFASVYKRKEFKKQAQELA